ncbi:MAG: lipopolysaccharide biosynthesis protein [Candidatus Omnitrophota bacterium]|jgi:O-antigen/teichoic acid export membrane protein
MKSWISKQIPNLSDTRKYSKWAWKSALSIAEQFILSGGNFVLSIFLARFISPSEFGVFVLAFSFLLLLSGFSNAFFFEPLSVIGPSKYTDNTKDYLGTTIFLQAVFSLLLVFIFTGVAILLFITGNINIELLHSLLGVSLSAPFILFFWLLRRICYMGGNVKFALYGSVTYVVILLCGLFFVIFFKLLSPFRVFLLMMFASIIASIMLSFLQIHQINITKFFNRKILAFAIFKDHWRYGRWIGAANITNWLGGDFYLILIGIFLGAPQLGAYSALEKLTAPLLQAVSALGLLFVPWLAKQKVKRGESYVQKNIGRLIFFNVLISIAYSGILLINGRFLVHLLYKKSYFDDFIWLLPFLMLIAVITAFQQSLSIAVRALEKPVAIFWAKFFSSVFVLTIGILCVYLWKFYGVIAGVSLGLILESFVMLYYVKFK